MTRDSAHIINSHDSAFIMTYNHDIVSVANEKKKSKSKSVGRRNLFACDSAPLINIYQQQPARDLVESIFSPNDHDDNQC
jgi:hypothetical protein